LPNVPLYAVFDTAFHRTIPEHASRYALPPDLADKHQIRRYGFHGISHRYLVERYAHLVGKTPTACNVVSLHLESGCSVTGVREGKSIDNTMGLTPLEGLMMGTRSGDVDPSVIPLLTHEEGMQIDEVMTLLNKKSGLLGVSGESLDTRVLMEQYDSNPRAKLAMDMFAYRAARPLALSLRLSDPPSNYLRRRNRREYEIRTGACLCRAVFFWTRNRCRSQRSPDRYRGKAFDGNVKDRGVGYS